jgi:hypothetical protein
MGHIAPITDLAKVQRETRRSYRGEEVAVTTSFRTAWILHHSSQKLHFLFIDDLRACAV